MVPETVLKGISLMLDIIESNDSLCYLEEDDKASIRAVGDWYQEQSKTPKPSATD